MVPRLGELTASRIRSVRAEAFRIPTDEPESDGTLEWDATTIVVVEVDAAGQTGLGYTYADPACAELARGRVADVLLGRSALDVAAAWHAVRAELRNEGVSGIAAMAASAADVALWDLKAKMLGTSLLDLLGAVRSSVPVYASGGFTSYDVPRLRRELGRWVDQGIARVKMKVGRRPEDDLGRVAAARLEVGDDVEVLVDADGAYGVRQAIEMARRLAGDHGVRWLEEPRPSSDLAGLARVREGAPGGLEIAAGEYAWDPADLRRLIDARAVDCLQADATRCGGISGFLAAGHLCEAARMPLSAHGAPALHALLGCAVEPVRHVERFHDHVRVESELFDGVAPIFEGRSVPNRGRPGHGLSLRGGQEWRNAI